MKTAQLRAIGLLAMFLVLCFAAAARGRSLGTNASACNRLHLACKLSLDQNHMTDAGEKAEGTQGLQQETHIGR